MIALAYRGLNYYYYYYLLLSPGGKVGRMPSPFRRRAPASGGGRRVLLGRFGGLVSALQSPGWALLLAVT